MEELCEAFGVEGGPEGMTADEILTKFKKRYKALNDKRELVDIVRRLFGKEFALDLQHSSCVIAEKLFMSRIESQVAKWVKGG
ncbi:hypothetical protein KC845_00230 [Candidatus Kaiserbacteria bacterium]|nr:hypothetical protein [Candidatus Kaiserbacteria bacterium]